MPHIEKIILEIAGTQIIPLPEKYEILSVNVKAKKPVLFIKVHESEVFDRLTIRIFMSDQELEDHDRLEFLSTVVIGVLVLHIFKLNKK